MTTKGSYYLDGREIAVEIEGGTIRGKNARLLDHDVNLCKGCDWEQEGFTIAPFVSTEVLSTIRDGLIEIVSGFMKKADVPVDSKFDLENYHRYVGDNEQMHMAVVEQFRSCLPIKQFPVDIKLVEERVSDICKKKVTVLSPDGFPEVFCIRMVRPNSTDNNPMHRDVWLDRLRHGINIYGPICGSTEASSLPLVPGSHLWKESEIIRTAEGATANGRKFTVPAVVDADHKIEAIRPNPNYGEVMVFSPYLIHGGAVNETQDKTRVSLEIRFTMKQN